MPGGNKHLAMTKSVILCEVGVCQPTAAFASNLNMLPNVRIHNATINTLIQWFDNKKSARHAVGPFHHGRQCTGNCKTISSEDSFLET